MYVCVCVCVCVFACVFVCVFLCVYPRQRDRESFLITCLMAYSLIMDDQMPDFGLSLPYFECSTAFFKWIIFTSPESFTHQLHYRKYSFPTIMIFPQLHCLKYAFLLISVYSQLSNFKKIFLFNNNHFPTDILFQLSYNDYPLRHLVTILNTTIFRFYDTNLFFNIM